MDEKDQENEMYPGFTITCQKCKSTDVSLENSLGFSAESGGWGSVDLKCDNCGYSVSIVEN